MFDLNTLAVINDKGDVLENLKDAGVNVTLSGIIIVFSILILLVFIIAAFGLVMVAIDNKKKASKAKTAEAPKPAPQKKAVAPIAAPVKETKNDDGVVAAISAAVAMMYEGTEVTPAIRSVRPSATGARSLWKQAGIFNNTRPF